MCYPYPRCTVRGRCSADHIAKTTSIVIPVTTECLVCTVLVVGLVRCGTQPQIVIKILGDRLLNQVLLTYPEELPVKACVTRDCNLQRPTQYTAVNQLLQRLNGCTQAVESILETEPSVKAEDTAILTNCLHNLLTLTDGTCHRLLAPDILTSLSSLNGHNTVPVGRSSDVNYVHVGIVDKVAIEVITLHLLVQALL